MRNISSNGLTKLANRHGNEPICIVEIDWYPGAKTMSYADRDIAGPPAVAGKIIELGNLDDVVDIVLTNGSSASINITLDDTDGSIKAIYNKYDLHKRDVRVYQWFAGLDLSDKFLLFAGKINTPVSWNERDRTVKLTVLSHIEDQEVGFSPEAGQFKWLPSTMVGKAWPMVFGTVSDVPATQITRALSAITVTPVGILTGSAAYLGAPIYESGQNQDIALAQNIFMQNLQASIWMMAAECWYGVDDKKSSDLLQQYNNMQLQIGAERVKSAAKENCMKLTRKAAIEYANTHGLGDNPIQTLGGEDFPQNTPIWISIGGGSFYGHFSGNLFYVEERVNIEDAVQVAQILADVQVGSCASQNTGKVTNYDFRQQVPCGSFCDLNPMSSACEIHEWGYTISPPVNNTNLVSQAGTSNYLKAMWKEGGQTITMETAQEISYVASIVPGNVLAVKAFKQYDGPRLLTTLPSDLYTIKTQTFGSITAVIVTVNRQLSTIKNPDGTNAGWGDDLYVTFQSSVGPDIINIIKYVITTYANTGYPDSSYTDLTWDDASFNYCQSKLTKFPANFALLDQKNVIDLLRDIAFQCRCAIWLADNKFYMRYLPEEPVSLGDSAWATTPQNRVEDTITVSDMDAETGVEVDYTPTENLVTKMKVTWKLGYAPDDPFPAENQKHQQTMILRHNIARYGVHEKTFDWYIFNQPDTILKCATFWLIRFSTTWKTLKFRTFLNKLNLETFDAILFDDRVNGVSRGYGASGPIKAVITKANYVSADDMIEIECELPVKAGQMEQYPFYWPSKLPVTTTWPPADEIASGDAGGGGIGVWASGDLPIGATNGLISGNTVFVGGPNVVYGPQSDRGERVLTDEGYTAQTVLPTDSYGVIPTSTRPHLNLGIQFLRESDPLILPQQATEIVLDLYKTKIVNSANKSSQQAGCLGDFFSLGSSNGGLRMELSVAQAVSTGVGTTGKDALLSKVFVIHDGTLMIDGTNAKFKTTDAVSGATFDFKYDSDGNKLGAGTAFLKE